MIGSVVQFAAISILLGIGSVMDIKTREIPNWINAAVVCTALLDFDIQNLWGLVVAAIFFVTALVTGKIGGGDVKLIAALSVVCGLWGSFSLLFFAQISMLIFYAGNLFFCKINGKTVSKTLPFVPFIFIGYLCSALIF